MRLKTESVRFADMKPGLLRVLATIEEIHQDITGQEAVVTSLNDGKHVDGSKHYSGEAADIRVWYTGIRTAEFAERIRIAHPECDVLYGDEEHLDHMHVEYDPK